MKIAFFYVNDTTGEVLDNAHYIDKISSMAIEAYRSGEFSSIKEANSRYFEMDHGFSKYSYDSEKMSLTQAINTLV